jgi:hypothetical protein
MALLHLWRRQPKQSDGRTKLQQSAGRREAPPKPTLTDSLPPPGGELRLADEPTPATRRHAASLGTDPYSSDGGFLKPHAWERVERD